MFKNELTVKAINGKSIVCNRYFNTNFWNAYGFKHFQRDIFNCGKHTTVLDTYTRYTNTVHGKRFQSMTIVFNKRVGEPIKIDGFRIETVNDNWVTLTVYNSYEKGVKKWTC